MKFTLWEKDAATRLGISPKVIRALREEHLVEGEDYSRGKRIMFTDQALVKLEVKLAMEAPEVPPPPAWLLMTVLDRKVSNRRMIIARPENSTDEIRVEINPAHKFFPGQRITATPAWGGIYRFRSREK